MLLKGDCIEVMKAMKPNSMDAVVTDPPYFLEFMNKEWDKADLIEPSFGYWLSGFVDGEGCFRIHRIRNGDYYETHFCINLRRDDKAILENIKNILGFGRVQDRKGGNGSKPQVSYIVNKREDCFKLAEIFLRFPLKAKKQRDFFKWCEALIAWKNQRKGNRWHGKPDVSKMERCWLEMKEIRQYQEKPMPVNKEEFMHRLWLTEAYRVLKPGGSMLVMGGTRTSHRLACAIEDSGFIIKDTIMFLYGSGFPKCQDITPHIDAKMLGITTRQVKERREKIGKNPNDRKKRENALSNYGLQGGVGKADITKSLTPEAKHWDGFKVGGIKPAYEPIIWAVKPPEGSYVDNVLKWGVGAVNVNECRVGIEPHIVHGKEAGKFQPTGGATIKDYHEVKGRFPANVILSHHPECVQVGMKKIKSPGGDGITTAKSHFQRGEIKSGNFYADKDGLETVEAWDCHPDCAVRLLDEQSGNVRSSSNKKISKQININTAINFMGKAIAKDGINTYSDNGGASRFFYCAKHPTVKPIKLFEWLIKLVTREGQIILDPFIGSGTTAISAHNTGRKCVGIEKEEEYIKIAKRRAAHLRSRPRQLEIT